MINLSESKTEIPTCNILGVNIAAINMEWVLNYIEENLNNGVNNMAGKYICVSNVHTTITSLDNPSYCDIQNNALMAIPDGGPLSTVAKLRGYKNVERVTGPDLMNEIFKLSSDKGYRHFFYGSTEDTLTKMKEKIENKYNINIVGTYSPPFRPLTEVEEKEIIKLINQTKPDFIWVGLGAPKQEEWMSSHKEEVLGLMIGVGAGFDYFAEKIKRAPVLMQRLNLEWLYRLIQDPKRLFKRYLYTNTKFLWYLLSKK
ncbi:WecB/TagA/CpsF family glycosyltransferase [Terribacillus saccharophilus]|uniref:WecB/TagA/CpsF family glycosyltransferase n=1 Tax=Terribacillus saccharophilus TaxID=361277 RepID=UPI002DCCA85D|nr:WecB/TagA/CpsF family glycosyltransferase [Terribacillus saccharophilus]